MSLRAALLAVASLVLLAARADAQQVSGKPAKPARRVESGLVATLPGFMMLPDGGSRLFVELTHAATVKERREGRALSYVIAGARVTRRNNENPLVTVHFNTPVTQARLIPTREGLAFSIELRADTAPTWRVADGEDGASVLQIDFPKGSFLPAQDQQDVAYDGPMPSGSVGVTSTAPAPSVPRAHHGHGGGHHGRGAPAQGSTEP